MSLPPLRSWAVGAVGPWDAAVAGSSALRAGILQVLMIEVARRLGLHWCLVLWDLMKFYDTTSRSSYLVRWSGATRPSSSSSSSSTTFPLGPFGLQVAFRNGCNLMDLCSQDVEKQITWHVSRYTRALN